MTQCSIIVTCASLRELSETEAAILSRSELRRADEFKASRRRRQYLSARALLRNTLQQFTGGSAASHALTTEDKGKPVCAGGPAVSIAHSGNLVVCAAADRGDIGVDIEVPGRRRNVSGIAENYFAADEVEWLATQPEDRFYMLWVLKEAWLKAKGTGIAGGLDRLRCIVTPPGIEARISDEPPPALSLHTIDDALVGVATTATPRTAVTINRWDSLSGPFDQSGDTRLIATTYLPDQRA